jgi:hypothetical protein
MPTVDRFAAESVRLATIRSGNHNLIGGMPLMTYSVGYASGYNVPWACQAEKAPSHPKYQSGRGITEAVREVVLRTFLKNPFTRPFAEGGDHDG